MLAESEAGSPKQDDWDEHWSNYAAVTARNPAQHYRMKLIRKSLQLRGGKKERILDIGSGTGDLVLDLRTRFPTATLLGLELSRSGCEIARRKVPNATFLECNLLEPVNPPESFARWANFAVCSEVLEHVDDPVTLLNHARAYMAPGCRVVITVPGGPMTAFDKHIGHRRHFDPAALSQTLKASGLQPIRAMRAGFPFHNLYRLAVMIRGESLIEDVTSESENTSKRVSQIVMAAFDALFKFNLESSPFGWQMVAIAENRGNRIEE